MAKSSGLGDNFYLGQYDLSGDVGAVQTVRGGRSGLIITGIDKSAMERTLGLKDGEIAFSTYWKTEVAQAHPVLSALPTADILVSYFRGTTRCNAAASLVAKQTNYDPSRGQDGSLVTTVSALANAQPLEWGLMLTSGKETFAAAANGASTDYGSASTLFGAAATLHAFSIASGTATVTVQDSANDSAFADIITFTNVTAATSERATTATVTTTVRRYIRVAVAGTFTNLVCAVNFVRFETSQTV